MKEYIRRIGDEELLGLSNKGIVKRGHKDYEALDTLPLLTEEEDAIKVVFPQAEVLLREPLSESSCNCPSGGLCKHIVMAVLAVQAVYGTAEKEPEAEGAEYPSPSPDPAMGDKSATEPSSLPQKASYRRQKKQGIKEEEVKNKQKQLLREILSFLTDVMNVGLNRAPESQAEEWMRLSIISHSVCMAGLEQRLKQLEQEWRHNRKSGGLSGLPLFLQRICSLYELAAAALHGDEGAEQQLTGAFRANYEVSDDCILYGLAEREYDGRGGFIGNIYYFLDWEKGSILTYQDLRPTGYEKRGKTAEALRKEEAPWELGICKEDLPGKKICLKNPRLSEDGKLSASQSTRGEYKGAAPLTKEMMGNFYYEDFGQVLEQYLPHFEEVPERGRLVFLHPFRMEEMPYDETAQQFRAAFFDREGRVIWLQINYHKKREYFIRRLTRLLERRKKEQKKDLVFFGKLFLDSRGVCFYPYEYYDYETERESGL